MRAIKIIFLAVVYLALAATASAERQAFERVDVAPVWAGHPVGFSLVTSGDFQYVGFYDPQRRMTIGQRRLGSDDWSFTKLPTKVKWDSHNGIVLAVDCRGHLHVSGNMHGSRLIYFRSLAPHDISRFERLRMVGDLERRVTYPQFLKGGNGCLYFQYRHGHSGDGLRIINRYDPETRSWSRLLAEPFFDGGGSMSAYLSGPVVGPDGYFHLVWMWRDTPYGSTNHDISYARSFDLEHWETVDGRPLSLPLTPETPGVVVDPVPSGGGLVAIAFGVGWDQAGRPIVSYSKYDDDGASQWYNARREGDQWRIYQTSRWDYRWELEQTGALAWDISVAPIGVDRDGRLTQAFTHIEEGSGVWVLDPDTLLPIDVLAEEEPVRLLKQVESEFDGMEVREFVYDRQGEYFLRWETLPVNRDQPREAPFPPPAMLRVYREQWLAERDESAVAAVAPGYDSTPGEVADTVADRAGDAPVRVADPDLDSAVLEAEGARIGDVVIGIADIFDERDPAENRKLFRFVNRLHPRTKEWVIREQLLFGPGEPYSARLLAESERILRQRSYIYDAEIRPIRYRDGVVDIEVETRDVWTLSGGVSFTREGGENDISLKINDDNILGFGRKFGLEHSKDVDRTKTEVTYLDTNLRGSRAEIEVKVANNSDGDRYLMHLRQPFYALNSRRAKGMTILLEDRVDPIFDLGELQSQFRHEIDFFEPWWGFSGGLREGSVTRWKLGFTYSSDRFSEVPEEIRNVFIAPITVGDPRLPPDRTLSYPWLDVEFVQDRFVEARDLNRIARTEDINLGTRLQGRLGYSSSIFGADEDLVVMGFNGSTGFRPSERTLLFTSVNGGARFGHRDYETVVVGGAARFFWRNIGRHALFAEVGASFVEDLDPEKQLLLGGDSGLRGYPLRYQSGDRRVLVTLEQRFFTDLEIFKLANVGGAIFFDAGRAWFEDSSLGEDLGVLKDIGFGLRISSSRSSGQSVFHFDVAFPLDGDDSIDDVQFFVKTKESF